MKIKQVMITGLLNTNAGDKMSKSAGNGLDPVAMFEKWGSDAIRYWAASCPLGEDVEWDEDRVEKGMCLIRELRGAKKYLDKTLQDNAWIMPNRDYGYAACDGNDLSLSIKNRDLLRPFNELMKNGQFRIGLELLERFFRDRVCTHYLEKSKGGNTDGHKHYFNNFCTLFNLIVYRLGIFMPRIYGELFLPMVIKPPHPSGIEVGYPPFSDVGPRGPYNINTPPPTVSGNLHMGHILSYVQIDIMARFKRQQGYEVSFPLGFELTLCKVYMASIRKGIILPIKSWAGYYRDLFDMYGVTWYLTSSLVAEELANKVFKALQEANIIYQNLDVYNDPRPGSTSYTFEDPERGFDGQFYLRVLGNDGKLAPDIVEAFNAVEWLDPLHKAQLDQWLGDVNRNWCITGPVIPNGVLVPGHADKMFATWFIFALTPLITNTPEIDLMPLGHDIIKTWLFYTIVMSVVLKRIKYE